MGFRKRQLLSNILLVSGSIFFTLIVAELVVRDYKSGFKNLVLVEGGNLIEHRFKGLYAYHPTLGWVPSANTSSEQWGSTVVATLDDGIRSNGNAREFKKGLLIMAVGDSFTFGDQIADYQTWPAFLERMIGYRVLNAGVSSYGLDQTILRAEELVPRYKPDILIVSFIFDDLDRCRHSIRHGAGKPYFDTENNQLVLKNVPVPFKPEAKLDPLRKVFGYSHLANKVMDRLFPEYWWKDTMKGEQYVEIKTSEVVPLLFKRLENFAKSGTRVIILVQGDLNVSRSRYTVLQYFLKYVRMNLADVEILNMFPYLLKLKNHDPEIFFSFFLPGGHTSPQGNALTATMLKRKIFKEEEQTKP